MGHHQVVFFYINGLLDIERFAGTVCSNTYEHPGAVPTSGVDNRKIKKTTI